MHRGREREREWETERTITVLCIAKDDTLQTTSSLVEWPGMELHLIFSLTATGDISSRRHNRLNWNVRESCVIAVCKNMHTTFNILNNVMCVYTCSHIRWVGPNPLSNKWISNASHSVNISVHSVDFTNLRRDILQIYKASEHNIKSNTGIVAEESACKWNVRQTLTNRLPH